MMKPPIFIVMATCVMTAICASVGWIGITEHQLTNGGRLGISTSLGLGAVVKGWFFIAVAFGFIGILVLRSRFRNIIFLGLFIIYFSLLLIYIHSAYEPWF